MARERLPASETPFEHSQRLLTELSQSLKIDKHGLDDELVHQPELYHRAGQEYSNAAWYRDKAKGEREDIKSRLNMEVRRDALKASEKVTNDAVDNRVIADERYKEAQAEYQEWDRLTSRWSSLREDFHSRGFALRELASLWIAGYNQSNSAGRDARDRRADEVRNRRGELVGKDRHRSKDDD